MQMLILQVILWLLLALLAGLFVGWLVRPFYCKDCLTNDVSSKVSGGLSGSVSGGLSGNATTTENYSADKNTHSSTATKVAATTIGAAATAVASKLVNSETSANDTQAKTSAPVVVADLDLNEPELDIEINLDNPELLADLEMELGLNGDELNADGLDDNELNDDSDITKLDSDDNNQSATNDTTKATHSASIKAGAATVATTAVASAVATHSKTSKSSNNNQSSESSTAKPTSKHEGPDDLTRINGIGKPIETILHDSDIYTFQQIADFTPEKISWFKDNVTWPPGSVNMSEWIEQAKVLTGEGQVAITEDMKPTLLTEPRSGSKRGDDLKRIKGIGKVLERRLKELGIYHYDQIAELSDDQVLWITDYISFPAGRIKGEEWIAQALALAEGETTEYSSRFDKGDTPYK